VPRPGFYREAINSDAEIYGSSGLGSGVARVAIRPVTTRPVGAGLPRTYRLGAPWCRWISRR